MEFFFALPHSAHTHPKTAQFAAGKLGFLSSVGHIVYTEAPTVVPNHTGDALVSLGA
jgi:hypothetical protein